MAEINENRSVQKFGGNTALESVSFDGWWVVGGGRCTFFRPHSGSELSIYPSYARRTLAPLGIKTHFAGQYVVMCRD